MTDPISTPNQTVDNLLNEIPLDIADAARGLGLKPVRAWVPDEKKKASTAGAERVRRCREQAEQLGFKQLSITAPIELHPMLKTLAARTRAGEPTDAVLAELLPKSSNTHADTAEKHPDAGPGWLEMLPAWRRWLLRWLLPSGITKPH